MTDLKVVEFPKPDDEPEIIPEVILVLDAMVDMAMKGTLKAIAVAGVLDTGIGITCHSGAPSRTALIGTIEMLKHRLINENYEDEQWVE